MNKIIPIARPNIGQEEIYEVTKVLRSAELSHGRWVEEFEEMFAKYVGTKFAIAVSNGTVALHLSLLSLGIKKGDEVITTPLTFMASSNSILYVGAKPVFIDIDPKTFNINQKLIEQKITVKTKAILPVHLYGLPADLENILRIAKKYNLYVVEDAAQAHGAKIGNKVVGSFGDLGGFSFYSTKNMTTGEGGMITTNNENLAKKIRMFRNHGMEKKYFHDILGFNFRMTNIQAAIGIQQLKKLNHFNQIRINNAKFLTVNLSAVDSIQTPFIPTGLTHVFHQYTILIKNGKEKRNDLSSYLQKNGVATMIYYPIPVHKQKFMQKMYRNVNMRNAEKATNCILSLPVHPLVTNRELQKIIKLIKGFFKN